jgi:hypothetical protein
VTMLAGARAAGIATAVATLCRGEQRRRTRHGSAGARGEGGVSGHSGVPRSSDDPDMWNFSHVMPREMHVWWAQRVRDGSKNAK